MTDTPEPMTDTRLHEIIEMLAYGSGVYKRGYCEFIERALHECTTEIRRLRETEHKLASDFAASIASYRERIAELEAENERLKTTWTWVWTT